MDYQRPKEPGGPQEELLRSIFERVMFGRAGRQGTTNVQGDRPLEWGGQTSAPMTGDSQEALLKRIADWRASYGRDVDSLRPEFRQQAPDMLRSMWAKLTGGGYTGSSGG